MLMIIETFMSKHRKRNIEAVWENKNSSLPSVHSLNNLYVLIKWNNIKYVSVYTTETHNMCTFPWEIISEICKIWLLKSNTSNTKNPNSVASSESARHVKSRVRRECDRQSACAFVLSGQLSALALADSWLFNDDRGSCWSNILHRWC